MLGKGGSKREIGEYFADPFAGGIDPDYHVLVTLAPGHHPLLTVDLNPDGPSFDDDRLVLVGGPRPA